MTERPGLLQDERRNDVRVAAKGCVDAVSVDRHTQPVKVLRQAEALDVSAGGAAIATATPLSPGEHLVITVGDDPIATPDKRFELQVVACRRWEDGRQVLHCKLISGRIPAELMYDWR